ncbi:Aminotran-1-2 domain-containing protein [Aphelenchoides besseyi]|nr:Aminotran-1-2 domain-containing protein [Aphelenchoides besseyi]
MADPFTLFESLGTAKHMLAVGAPGPKLLKRVAELMAEVTPKRLADEQTPNANGRLMQYGAQMGDPRFLNYLTEFLKFEYDDDVDRETLVQTAGATTALVLMFTQLFPRRSIVYCEQLSYFLGFDILQSLGFTCKPVPLESDGIVLEKLEAQLTQDLGDVEKDRAEGRYSAAIYLVPVYQNPTGCVLSEEKCQKLVQLARKYNLLVFCDDVYNFYTYNGVNYKRLFAYDNPKDLDYGSGHVISNGTFSKLLAPGLRLGWMELPKKIRQKYWIESPILTSSGSLNTYTGGLVAELLHSGLASEHIAMIRGEQKKKMERAHELLNDHLPSGCKLVNKSQGGYFLYILLPKTINSTDAVAYILKSYDISTVDGRRFLVGSKSSDQEVEIENGIRLSIAYPPYDEMEEAFKLVCKALHELTSQSE